MFRFLPLRLSSVLLLLLLGLSLGWGLERVVRAAPPTRAIEAAQSSLELQIAGDTLVAEKRYSEALTTYKKAARLSLDSPAVHLRIGSLYQLKNRYSDAEQELRLARELSPGDPEITFRLGQVYLALSYYPEAEEALRDTLLLIDQPKQIAKTQQLLGEVYLATGNADGALRLFDQVLAVDNNATLAKQFRALLALPSDISLARRLFSEVARSSDSSLAPKATSILARMDRWEGLSESELPFQSAIILVEQGLPAIAINYLHPILEGDPNHRTARDYVGYAYFLQGDIARAERELDFRAALEGGPSELTRYYLGELYSYQNRWIEAVESFERSIDQGMHSIEVYTKLGHALQATKQYTQATKAYERALEVEPNDLSSRVSMMNILLLQLKDYDKAIALAERTMEMFPEQARPKSLLGWALLEKGESEAAETLLREALAIDPFDASAYLNLGILYERQGRVDAAITAYQKALDYDYEADIARLADDALRRLLR